MVADILSSTTVKGRTSIPIYCVILREELVYVCENLYNTGIGCYLLHLSTARYLLVWMLRRILFRLIGYYFGMLCTIWMLDEGLYDCIIVLKV